MLAMTFFLFSFFQNCSEYDSLLSHSEGPGGVSCKIQPTFSTPFEENKIQINTSFLEETEQDQASHDGNNGVQQKTKVAKTKIELSLLVDPLCLSREENPVRVLGEVIEVPPELGSLSRAAVSLTVYESIDMDQLTQEMNHPCLVGISENQTVTLETVHPLSTTLNDPMAGDQAHLNFVNYHTSIALQEQITAPVVIAVVDSGIDKHHIDLRDRLWDDGQGNPGRSFASNTNPDDLSDNTNHGTHIAGIIAASQNNERGTAGLNHNFVQIMVVRIFNNPESSVITIYNGIRYAMENGADIINLSLSTKNSNSTLDQAVIEAVNAGIVVVMAASNDSRMLSSSFCPSPACIGHELDGGLSVASVDTSTENLSNFSNFSSSLVEIAAPGSESGTTRGLLSTITGNQWGRKPGTSMAAPIVSAAAALLIGYLKTNNIHYTPHSIENFLKEGGSRINQRLQSQIQEGRIIDFKKIIQNLDSSYIRHCL